MAGARLLAALVWAMVLGPGVVTRCAGSGEGRAPRLEIVDAEPTIFFATDGDSELQIVRATVENATPDPLGALVRARGAGRTTESDPVTVEPGGRAEVEVRVVPAEPGEVATIALSVLAAGGGVESRASVELPYQRRWRLYMAPFSHLDVGFTQSQANVLAKQKQGLDRVLDLIDETADFPEGSRFRFTVEQSWPLVEYLADPAIGSERKQKLLDHARAGRIEVCAFLNGHINKFVGDEQLVRSTYFSAERMRRELGIEVVSAMLNDVGDASSAPLVLGRAGIRYFQYGPNTIHYPLPALFHLSPPRDPTNRILAWLTPLGGYGENLDLGLRPPLPPDPTKPHDPDAPVYFDDYRRRIEEHLTALQETGLPLPSVAAKYSFGAFRCPYPYDAYFLTYYPAHDGDNGIQDRLPSDIAKDWNERYAWPRVVVSTIREFFEYVEDGYTAEIPDLAGDFEGFWGEQIFFADEQVDPGKEARNRAFDRRMAAAEGFSSAALMLDPAYAYDREGVRAAYEHVLLNNDHNPGPVPISGSHYTEEDVEDWKRVHTEWDLGSTQTALSMLDRATGWLASRIHAGAGDPFAVFNPSSWERGDFVEIDTGGRAAGSFAIQDLATGENIAYQDAGGGRVLFEARAVPAIGYRTYAIVEGGAAAGPSTSSASAREEGAEIVLENEFYRLRIPKESSGAGAGGIASLFDKEIGRELVDGSGGAALARFTVALRGEAVGLKKLMLDEPGFLSARAWVVETGPLRARVRVEGVYDPALKTPAIPYLIASVLTIFAAPEGTPLPPRHGEASPVLEVALLAGKKRVELEHIFVSPAEQSLENMIAYPFAIPDFGEAVVAHHFNPVRAGPQDPYGARGISAGEPGASFVTIPLQASALNTFNATFLWVEGAPPDTMFRSFVDLSGESHGVTLACRESGMAVLGGLDRDGFTPVTKPVLHHLLLGPTYVGTVLFGNEPGGTFSFHTALTSHAGPWNGAGSDGFGGEASAERFGRAWESPFTVAGIPSDGPGGALPSVAGFISVDRPNLIVTTLKPAEDGRGFILRLYETDGVATTGRVSLPMLAAPLSATLTTSVERDLSPLSSDSATPSFEVSVPAHGLATVRVEGRQG